MPTNSPRLDGDVRRHTGQGVGCSFLLEQGLWADHAVIAKPGWTVSHEEVGLAWFEVTVHGTHTYVGSRHRLPYRNPIALAGEMVAGLEAWFEEYAVRHTSGTIAPQGVVSAIEGGWMRMAAVTRRPAGSAAICGCRRTCRLSAGETRVRGGRRRHRAEGGADVTWEMVLAIPGTRTDPSDRVVASTVAAFEEAEGGPHEPVLGNSGATDANILRSRGIPTVRIGMPKARTGELGIDPASDFQMGMNTVDLREMERLTRLLIRVAIDVIGVRDAG